MSCSNQIIKDDLVLYFDVSDINSYNLNSSYTLTSLSTWKHSVSSSFYLPDFGITGVDNGRTNKLTNDFAIDIFDKKLNLYRVGKNDGSGKTIYDNLDLTYNPTSVPSIGFSGGYLQSFFKLDGYDYELLPYRHQKGLSLEFWLQFTPNTFSSITSEKQGFFSFLGTRAENKYTYLYTGETNVRTSSGHTLGPDNPKDFEDGIYDNTIGFRITKDKKIGYRYINDVGITVENYSQATLPSSGWTHIVITYEPDNLDRYVSKYEGYANKLTKYPFIWEDVMDCVPKRDGELKFYVNGRPFFKEQHFPEQFWFKKLNTQSQKQVGVPYNISLGGGSFGLKNSWRFETIDLILSGRSIYTNYLVPINAFYNQYSQSIIQSPAYIDKTLLIEDNYDGSFIGNFSKFRFYTKSLNITNVQNNFNTEANYFGLKPIKGGRVIYT